MQEAEPGWQAWKSPAAVPGAVDEKRRRVDDKWVLDTVEDYWKRLERLGRTPQIEAALTLRWILRGRHEAAASAVPSKRIEGFSNTALNTLYICCTTLLVQGEPTYWSEDGGYFMYWPSGAEGMMYICPRLDEGTEEDNYAVAARGETVGVAMWQPGSFPNEWFEFCDGSWCEKKLKITEDTWELRRDDSETVWPEQRSGQNTWPPDASSSDIGRGVQKAEAQTSKAEWYASDKRWSGGNKQWSGSDKQWSGSDKQWSGSDKQWSGSDKQWYGREKQWPGGDKQWSGEHERKNAWWQGWEKTSEESAKVSQASRSIAWSTASGKEGAAPDWSTASSQQGAAPEWSTASGKERTAPEWSTASGKEGTAPEWSTVSDKEGAASTRAVFKPSLHALKKPPALTPATKHPARLQAASAADAPPGGTAAGSPLADAGESPAPAEELSAASAEALTYQAPAQDGAQEAPTEEQVVVAPPPAGTEEAGQAKTAEVAEWDPATGQMTKVAVDLDELRAEASQALAAAETVEADASKVAEPTTSTEKESTLPSASAAAVNSEVAPASSSTCSADASTVAPSSTLDKPSTSAMIEKIDLDASQKTD